MSVQEVEERFKNFSYALKKACNEYFPPGLEVGVQDISVLRNLNLSGYDHFINSMKDRSK